jgi:hypothetical protein
MREDRGRACHILRTDQKNASAVAIDYVERVNRAIAHIVRNLAEPPVKPA